MTQVVLALVVSIVGLIINLATLFGIVAKIVRWIDRQKEQDDELANIRHEQAIIMTGLLACLKGILGEVDEKEVKSIIKLTENHLNEKAHQ
jgi:hypothetical protein